MKRFIRCKIMSSATAIETDPALLPQSTSPIASSNSSDDSDSSGNQPDYDQIDESFYKSLHKIILNLGIRRCGDSGFFRNYCLPCLGCSRWKETRVDPTEPHGEDLISELFSFCSIVCTFFEDRVLPEVKEGVKKLTFPADGQMEADGLSLPSTQLWTAAFLTTRPVTFLKAEEIEKYIVNYVDVCWAAERTAAIGKSFHSILQEFKRQMLPLLMFIEKKTREMGKKYKLARSSAIVAVEAFGDLDPPEDVSRTRRIDSLFVNDKLRPKAQIHPVVLASNDPSFKSPQRTSVFKKSLTKNPLASKSDENKEAMKWHGSRYIVEMSVEYQKRIPVRLLMAAQYSLSLLEGNLKDCHRSLIIDTQAPSYSYPAEGMNCLKAMKRLRTVLLQVFREVRLSRPIYEEITDWIDSIGSGLRNYFGFAQWVCDKAVESAAMGQLAYVFAGAHGLSLPNYQNLYTQVHLEINGSGGNKTKLFTKQRDFSDRLNFICCRNPKMAKKDMRSASDFFSTEYSQLLLRLPIIVEKDKIILRKEMKEVREREKKSNKKRSKSITLSSYSPAPTVIIDGKKEIEEGTEAT